MIYRKFGNTGIEMSSLGFGCMRFPMMEVDGKKIVNDEIAIPMVHKAYELGVNYFDTAPGYLDGLSEISVGKAVKGFRDKIYISTKNPVSDNNGDTLTKNLEGSLKKLDMDYVDFYHMWGINIDTFRNKIMVKGGHMEAALKAKEQGLIKHISFSFHDDPNNMKEIIDSGYFESVLLQYNLLDRSNEENINYAYEKGLGIVVMGPVGGGRLGSPSPVINDLLKDKAKSTAEMALRFVLANQKVTIALSGMSAMEMVTENTQVASIEGHLTTEEKAKVEEMLNETKRMSELYCTGCNYCMPCPKNIDIPKVFSIMNYHRVYGLTDHAIGEYANLTKGDKPGVNADACVSCGACEKKCPQHIKIISQLKDTHATLSK